VVLANRWKNSIKLKHLLSKSKGNNQCSLESKVVNQHDFGASIQNINIWYNQVMVFVLIVILWNAALPLYAAQCAIGDDTSLDTAFVELPEFIEAISSVRGNECSYQVFPAGDVSNNCNTVQYPVSRKEYLQMTFRDVDSYALEYLKDDRLYWQVEVNESILACKCWSHDGVRTFDINRVGSQIHFSSQSNFMGSYSVDDSSKYFQNTLNRRQLRQELAEEYVLWIDFYLQRSGSLDAHVTGKVSKNIEFQFFTSQLSAVCFAPQYSSSSPTPPAQMPDDVPMHLPIEGFERCNQEEGAHSIFPSKMPEYGQGSMYYRFRQLGPTKLFHAHKTNVILENRLLFFETPGAPGRLFSIDLQRQGCVVWLSLKHDNGLQVFFLRHLLEAHDEYSPRVFARFHNTLAKMKVFFDPASQRFVRLTLGEAGVLIFQCGEEVRQKLLNTPWSKDNQVAWPPRYLTHLQFEKGESMAINITRFPAGQVLAPQVCEWILPNPANRWISQKIKMLSREDNLVLCYSVFLNNRDVVALSFWKKNNCHIGSHHITVNSDASGKSIATLSEHTLSIYNTNSLDMCAFALKEGEENICQGFVQLNTDTKRPGIVCQSGGSRFYQWYTIFADARKYQPRYMQILCEQQKECIEWGVQFTLFAVAFTPKCDLCSIYGKFIKNGKEKCLHITYKESSKNIPLPGRRPIQCKRYWEGGAYHIALCRSGKEIDHIYVEPPTSRERFVGVNFYHDNQEFPLHFFAESV